MAEWVMDRPSHYMCSECGAQWGLAALKMCYCPSCGKEMGGGGMVSVRFVNPLDTVVSRLKEKIAAINPDVEGHEGAEFDIGCIQGMRWAIQEIEQERGDKE